MTIRRVLLVDDEEDIRTVAKMGLAEVGGLEVTLAASGEEALRVAEAARPDVIVLDYMMPGLDGPETFSRLREIPSLEQTPIVFLTAKQLPGEVEHLLSLGARGVLAKPFDPITLHEELQRVLAG